jgi:hypothetical protein
MYLWTRDQRALRALSQGGRVRLELDPGSGGVGNYQLVPVQNATEVARVCGIFRKATRDQVQAEIAGGSIPRFITALPFNLAPCERGKLWQIHY